MCVEMCKETFKKQFFVELVFVGLLRNNYCNFLKSIEFKNTTFGVTITFKTQIIAKNTFLITLME